MDDEMAGQGPEARMDHYNTDDDSGDYDNDHCYTYLSCYLDNTCNPLALHHDHPQT